jgi:hypothetical protein
LLKPALNRGAIAAHDLGDIFKCVVCTKAKLQCD